MPNKIKFTLKQLLQHNKDKEFDASTTFYTKPIIHFMRDITKKNIIHDIDKQKPNTKQDYINIINNS